MYSLTESGLATVHTIYSTWKVAMLLSLEITRKTQGRVMPLLLWWKFIIFRLARGPLGNYEEEITQFYKLMTFFSNTNTFF